MPTYLAYLSQCQNVIHPVSPHHNVPLYMYYIRKGHLWIYKWPKTGHLWFNNICTRAIKMLTFTQMNISVYHLMWYSVVTRISCVPDNKNRKNTKLVTRFCKLCLVYSVLCSAVPYPAHCCLCNNNSHSYNLQLYSYTTQPHKYNHTIIIHNLNYIPITLSINIL